MSDISIFELILKGMAIGFLAATPTGPSGVLVIQRTLNKGRWKGFLTGLGVSISDAIYIFITMMCLSLVLGYLENPTIATVVKLAGCVLLLVFGITTVRNNPLASSKEVKVKKDSIWQIMLTGFGVAIVNPLVVFFYMGLFVILGDFCWWFTLSTLINKLRNRFDLRGLWMINRILGTILIVAAVSWCTMILINL